MTDLSVRFAPLAVEPESARVVRGVAFAVAQEWAIRLPDGPAKKAALDHLAEAAKLAVAACAD